MRDLIFTALFMLMALLSLRRAHLGMMLWVWSALFPPNEFLFGFAQGIPFNKISVLCTILGLCLDRRKSWSVNGLLLLLLIFLAEATVSYASAALPPNWGAELYERLVKVIIAALFIRFTMVSRLRLHSLVCAICLAAGSGTLDECLKFLLSGGGHHVKGPTSWGDENISATIILMVMPLTLYIRRYSTSPLLRQGLMAAVVAFAIAVIGTYSRGGFIGLVIFGLVMLPNAKRPSLTFLIFLALAGLGMMFVPQDWLDRVHSTSNAGQDGSFMGRVIQWKILTLMALDHPLLGGGILANLVPSIWAPYAARLGSELTFIQTPPPTIPYASHSIYFQVLGENGFTGLAIFLLLYRHAFRIVADIRKFARREPRFAWGGDMAVSIRMSLILYLVTGAALPIPYLEFPFLLLGCLSALQGIQETERKKWQQEQRSAELEQAV